MRLLDRRKRGLLQIMSKIFIWESIVLAVYGDVNIKSDPIKAKNSRLSLNLALKTTVFHYDVFFINKITLFSLSPILSFNNLNSYASLEEIYI